MRKPSRREWVLLALVPVVILIAAGAERDGGGVSEAVAQAKAKGEPRAPKVRPAPDDATAEGERALKKERLSGDVLIAQAEELDPAQLRRKPASGEPANAFESKSWYVPPPPPPPAPPAPPLPPPVPTAPPLPFTYLGQYQDSDKPVILLVKQDRIYTVKAGDVIEGTYRVEGIVGATLGLTYLPLNIKQILNIGTSG